ncbi:DoxX family membrane protein [Pedobacter sp. HMF7647]|uniref:DoxX family membrane protein n=1 Tax=Hufsiella arboris TaxID=2695275 RepID=A0A7K1YAF3_9SPHI|nr:DoxX family membrane protein [Hufsiella arboris]MXV51553.1 DoxX family membrane protein [Hufsiella arboris]
MNQIIPPAVLRALFALPFVVFGVFHFMNASQMQAAVPSYLPQPIFWVYGTGVCMILGGIALIINKFAKLAGYLLGLLLLSFIIMVHVPGLMKGDQMEIIAILKDFSLMAGAMFIANFSAK